MTDTMTDTIKAAIAQILDDRAGSAAIELVRHAHGDEYVARLRHAVSAASDALDHLADVASDGAGECLLRSEVAGPLTTTANGEL